MNTIFTKGTAVLAAGLLAATGTLPAFAAPAVAHSHSDASIEASVGTPQTDNNDQATIDAAVKNQENTPGFKQKLKDIGDEMTTRRINSLNTLETDVNGMKGLSTSDKATLDARIESYRTQMVDLKAKIDADTDLDTLISDVESITIDYRI